MSFAFLKVQNFSICISVWLFLATAALASDWEEDNKSAAPASPTPEQESRPEVHRIKRQTQIQETPAASNADEGIVPFTAIDSQTSEKGKAPLQGKIEKTGTKSGLMMQGMEAQAGQSDPLSGKAIDDELRGMVNDGSLKSLAPALGQSGAPLKGRASLQGGKGGLLDPDEDDQELMVEWDRWHNRFLRAVQLGVQELLNNPDPEDYERPRVDPVTGNFTNRYPLGTGAAFSCQVTADGQIKNLEIVETSNFPKYDRAVLRAVQQLAGTRILVFPKGSHRRNVIQPGRIKTATTNDFKYHHFGDVERVPGR